MLLPNDFMILSVEDAEKLLKGLDYLCERGYPNKFISELAKSGLSELYNQLDLFVKNKSIQVGITNRYIDEVC